MKKVAVTLGDPWGIGPEITVKALAAGNLPLNRFVIFGPAEVWHAACARFDLSGTLSGVPVKDSGPGCAWNPGHPPADGGSFPLRALQDAINAVRNGEVGPIVTAPVNKELIQQIEPSFIGHTEYLGEAFQVPEPTMFFSGPQMEIGLVTTHVSMRELPDLITKERVLLHIRRLNAYLKGQGKAGGRIGVCGLNPHAGEGGAFGREELDEIAPAVEEGAAEGIPVSGPYPADSLCKKAIAGEFTLVLAMYHDQALTLFKATDRNAGVNISLGLPVLRTSPDHGTAYDIAGTGSADFHSMEAAAMIACRAAGC